MGCGSGANCTETEPIPGTVCNGVSGGVSATGIPGVASSQNLSSSASTSSTSSSILCSGPCAVSLPSLVPGLAPGLDRGSIHVCRTSPELRREAAVDTCAGDDTPLETEECLVAGLLVVGGAFLNEGATEGGRCRADLAAASGRCSIAGSEISRHDMDSSSSSSRVPTAPAGTPPVGVVGPKIKGGTIGCCLRVGGRRCSSAFLRCTGLLTLG